MYLYITKIRKFHDWSYFEACLLHLSRMSLIFKNRQEAHFVSRIDVNPTISIKNLYTLIGKGSDKLYETKPKTMLYFIERITMHQNILNVAVVNVYSI